jgi:4-hydroxythreonine-4-phosphate dehydrogenase
MPPSAPPKQPVHLGISLGDPTGIGAEITLKALAAIPPDPYLRFTLTCDPDWLHHQASQLKLPPPGSRLQTQIQFHNPQNIKIPHPINPNQPLAAQAALSWLTATAQLCLQHQLDGMITAPLSKESIIRTGTAFVGQTEYLTQLAGNPRTGMMLLGQDHQQRWLRVMLVTTHLPIAKIPRAITPESIENAVQRAHQACTLLNLPQARIAVCGLNPHAGEGGHMGTEEITTIQPTIKHLKQSNYNVIGPISGDTAFHAALQGHYDVVVAMFHDQGLAPLKTVAFDSGVNWTVGLPFPRTSPDHGPAYDIAGKNLANASSMVAAIQLARKLASTSPPLS